MLLKSKIPELCMFEQIQMWFRRESDKVDSRMLVEAKTSTVGEECRIGKTECFGRRSMFPSP